MAPFKVKVKWAAQLMGATEMFVRIGLRRGLLPFGCAFQQQGESRKSKWSYNIPSASFAQYLGISEERLFDEIQRFEQ